jgi:hypothetical protein
MKETMELYNIRISVVNRWIAQLAACASVPVIVPCCCCMVPIVGAYRDVAHPECRLTQNRSNPMHC